MICLGTKELTCLAIFSKVLYCAPANSESNIRIPALTEPESYGSLTWQTDGKTKKLQGTIFDFISKLKP